MSIVTQPRHDCSYSDWNDATTEFTNLVRLALFRNCVSCAHKRQLKLDLLKDNQIYIYWPGLLQNLVHHAKYLNHSNEW